MKKLLLICITLLSAHLKPAAQSFDWAHSYKGPGDQAIRDIATDDQGNVYIVGDFTDSLDLDPTANDNVVHANGFNDIFFAKVDSNGVVQWIKTIGASNNELSKGIAVDNSGNVIICGAFTTTVDFDPGVNVSTLNFQGVADGFVAKYDNNGNFIWVRQQGGTGEDYTNGVTCDANGNVFTTGFYSGTAYPDYPQTSPFNVSQGLKDIWIIKYTPAGAYVWSRSMGGPSNDGGVGIDLDMSDAPVITGYYQGTADFDPGVSTANYTSNGGSDIFALKLDTAGNFIWAGTGFFNGMYTDEPTSVHVGNDDKVYVTGYTNLQAMGLMVRMSSTGQGEKFVGLSHPTFAPGNYCVIYDVRTDAAENIYLCGVFNGSVDMDADTGSSQVNLVTSDDADVFVAKYDSSGAEVWMKYSSTADAQVNYAMAMDADDNIYLAGAFYDTIDCDYDNTTALLSAQQSADAHLHRLRQQSTASVSGHPAPTALSLYPNPATNVLYINGSASGKLQVFSFDGRLVLETNDASSGINTSGLVTGNYLIRLTNNNGEVRTGKFTKE